LDELYARAAVFVFLSEYEGFGFTPLEALSAGVPPVVLDTPIAREIYGDAARYVHTLSSPQSLTSALIDVLTNDSARMAVLAHRDAVLARYDWGHTASATLRAIEEAANA
jgi:glycosyltransferase involved in cell wall biosynthesis